MKRSLILLVAGTSLCALVLMTQTTNDDTKSISDQVVLLAAPNITSIEEAAANEALLPETALVEVAGANLDLMMAAVNSPPNCNINLATVKNAQVQVTAITAANNGNVNTGPPAAAIVQVVNVSPPQVVVALATSCQPPNLGVAFLELRTALHQGGQSQGSVSARANLVT